MISKFMKPITPNFLRTKVGTFGIGLFSKKELDEYCKLWVDEIKRKHKIAEKVEEKYKLT